MRFIFLVLIATLGILPGIGAAQSFPTQTVKIVVPFAPGGPNDMIARTLAQYLGPRWNVSVVIENRPGGGGSIGAQLVSKSSDGHTLLMASSNFASHPALFPNGPYNLQTDFIPVIKVVDGPIIIAVHETFPASDILELIDYSKKHSRGVAYASSGIASLPHLAGEALKVRTGANLVHVPYKGDAPAVTALLGGSVPVGFVGFAASRPHFGSRKIRALAVTTAKRLDVLPDTPTVAESIPGFVFSGWYGLLAPAGTQKSTIDQISNSVMGVLEEPQVQNLLRQMGLSIAPLGATQFKPFFESEINKLSDVIDKAGIKAE